MHRKPLPMLAAGLVVGTIVASMSMASAQTDGTETFTLVAKVARVEIVDVGAEGESPGDVVVIKNRLWDENQQNRVGTNWIECTRNFGAVVTCTLGVEITGRGQLTGTGFVRQTAESFDFPITGGTGDFANVSGWVHVTAQPQDQELEEFHLNNVG
jgi:hypothetical protein